MHREGFEPSELDRATVLQTACLLPQAAGALIRLFSCQTSKVKGAATRWVVHDPGVTAPEFLGDEDASSCFRCFGSGNAAPALLDQLFGAIEIALFGLIIRRFER